jgi:hypothetical protein
MSHEVDWRVEPPFVVLLYERATAVVPWRRILLIERHEPTVTETG